MFSGIAFNMMNEESPKAECLVTGWWSHGALEEQTKFGRISKVLASVTKHSLAISELPEDWNLEKESDFFHYCDNETGTGFEIKDFPFYKVLEKNLVCDMSSSIGTK